MNERMSGWHVIAFQMKTLFPAQAITIWCLNVHHNAFNTTKVHIVICNLMAIVHSAFNRWQWSPFFTIIECIFTSCLRCFGFKNWNSFSFFILFSFILCFYRMWFYFGRSNYFCCSWQKNIWINLNFLWYGW